MDGDAAVRVEVDPGVGNEALAEEDAVLVDLIPWLATDVGCVVIWPVTVPTPVVRP